MISRLIRASFHAPLLTVLLRPAGPGAHARACDEGGEVAVALGRPDDERGGSSVHAQLRPDDGAQVAARVGGMHEARDPAQVGGVGDAEGGVA